MKERPCIRCQQTIPLEDGHLVYCSHCGAPQIFLAEEMQQELEESARAWSEQANAVQASMAADASSPARPRSIRALLAHSPGETPWAMAIRFALLSAAVAFALAVLSLALSPLSFFTVLWVLGAPMLTASFFKASSRESPGLLPLRLGLVTGALVALSCAAVFVLSLVLSRFVFHGAGTLDAQLAALFAQQRSLLLERMGREVQPTVNLFSFPEYRVGLLLSVMSTSTIVYLLFSALTAGLAGLLVRRRPG